MRYIKVCISPANFETLAFYRMRLSIHLRYHIQETNNTRNVTKPQETQKQIYIFLFLLLLPKTNLQYGYQYQQEITQKSSSSEWCK